MIFHKPNEIHLVSRRVYNFGNFQPTMSLLDTHETQVHYFQSQNELRDKLEDAWIRLDNFRKQGNAEKWPCRFSMHWSKLESLQHEIKQKLEIIQNNRELHQYLHASAKAINQQIHENTEGRTALVKFIDRVQNQAGKLENIYKIEAVKEALDKYRKQKSRELQQDPNANLCKECKTSFGEQVPRDGVYACSACGCCQEAPPDCRDGYKGTIHMNSSQMTVVNYKRKNHFNELLSRAQGKENTEIHPNIIACIKETLFRYGYRDLDTITPKHIKDMLKRCGWPTFFEHRVKIWSIITGRRPFLLETKQEEALRLMFDMIQQPFEQCPKELLFDSQAGKERDNFLSYEYVFAKLCELLNIWQLKKKFKVLKSIKILIQHDRIWKFICDCLEWPNFPTDPLNNTASNATHVQDFFKKKTED